MLCPISWAKWEVVGTSGVGTIKERIEFVDKATIKKDGTIAKMWTMNSYLQAQKDPAGDYISEKALSFFDCKNDTWEVRALITFSGFKGEGNIIFSESFEHRKWIPVAPDSSAEDNLKIACRRK